MISYILYSILRENTIPKEKRLFAADRGHGRKEIDGITPTQTTVSACGGIIFGGIRCFVFINHRIFFKEANEVTGAPERTLFCGIWSF